jgi:hypothetical protein
VNAVLDAITKAKVLAIWNCRLFIDPSPTLVRTQVLKQLFSRSPVRPSNTIEHTANPQTGRMSCG